MNRGTLAQSRGLSVCFTLLTAFLFTFPLPYRVNLLGCLQTHYGEVSLNCRELFCRSFRIGGPLFFDRPFQIGRVSELENG